MGHLHLSRLPDTVPWRRVVERLAEGADVANVASAASSAALDGLERARDDDGLIQTLWLLAHTALAARTDDFAEALSHVGIRTSRDPDVFELCAGFTSAIDNFLLQRQSRSDLSDLAQMAGIEALNAQLTRRSNNLYETTPSEVRAATYAVSTKNGFSDLAHEFFTCFTQRFLNYHLSRELSNHVGGNGCFAEPEEHSQYLEQLKTHCREVSAIARKYAGDWYSKSNFEDGITFGQAKRFCNHVLKKLGAELQVREARHAQ